jgi:hypothetical protein
VDNEDFEARLTPDPLTAGWGGASSKAPQNGQTTFPPMRLSTLNETLQ